MGHMTIKCAGKEQSIFHQWDHMPGGGGTCDSQRLERNSLCSISHYCSRFLVVVPKVVGAGVDFRWEVEEERS